MWCSEVKNKFLLTPQTTIIKNIVYEIIRECDKRNFVCEKKFVVFLVHLIALQFKDEFDCNEKLDRKSIEELISICLNHIIDLNETPMNITLKMQVFFIENSKSYEETINEYHENLSKKTNMLVKKIIESPAKDKDELLLMKKRLLST